MNQVSSINAALSSELVAMASAQKSVRTLVLIRRSLGDMGGRIITFRRPNILACFHDIVEMCADSPSYLSAFVFRETEDVDGPIAEDVEPVLPSIPPSLLVSSCSVVDYDVMTAGQGPDEIGAMARFIWLLSFMKIHETNERAFVGLRFYPNTDGASSEIQMMWPTYQELLSYL